MYLIISKIERIPYMTGYPVYMSIRDCIDVYTSIRIYIYTYIRLYVYTSIHLDDRAFALFEGYAKLQSRNCNREIINCNRINKIAY